MVVGVLPAYRQQGIARQLLALMVPVAEVQGRRLLVGNTNGRVPAGEQFMERLGASRGLATHINQLALADLESSLLDSWLQIGQKQTAEFDLSLWQGPYPEDRLEEIVALHEVMNQQPYDDLDVEEFHITGEQLRQIEANLVAQGVERWTFYVQERASGKLAGYTEMMFLPDRPAVASQGDTGVFPEFRGKGLGRWLKAVMLEKVLAERPSVHFIRTGNADSNTAMLKINRELGFKPHLSQTIWQVETGKVRGYLAEKP
jgi:GNAT superfamily N-acetyltransferase